MADLDSNVTDRLQCMAGGVMEANSLLVEALKPYRERHTTSEGNEVLTIVEAFSNLIHSRIDVLFDAIGNLAKQEVAQ